jgi:hypothetical protein
MQKHLWWLIVLQVAFMACSGGPDKVNARLFEVDAGSVSGHQDLTNPEDVIFYNFFSPVDISPIINKQSAYFNSSLLNPINNINRYSESHKIALNLGVYGADLSYLWAFDQTQQSLSYLAAIQRLSEQLGIPRDFVDFTTHSAEHQSQQTDSLIKLVRETYFSAQRYLQVSDRESAAVFILLGGWVETLYIATNLYGQPNAAFISKIATQKFSLNSLIVLLQNQQTDLKATEYLILLRNLKAEFDKFEIKFPADNIVIDTAKKQIRITESAQVNLAPAQLNGLRNMISQIRGHIID